MKISLISRIIIIGLSCFLIAIVLAGLRQTTLQAFTELFQDDGFLNAILFSLHTSVIATLCAFLLGVPSGFFLARNNSLISRIIDVLFDIPIVIPPLIVGVLLMSFFNQPLISRIYPFMFTPTGAIIAQFFVAVPFTVKSSKSAFELVSPAYERIAMTLGAKPIRSFYDTTFKIAFPGILSGLILTWLRCVGEFGATLMVGGGIPGKTENIPINVYLNMISGDFEKGLSAGILAIGLAFLCIILINLFFLKRRPLH